MKSFTPKHVSATRGSFVRSGYPIQIAEFDGKQVEYFVLPNSLNAELPAFAFRMTGDEHKPMLFGVSESVPVERRRFWVAHEFEEFKHGVGDVGSCASTLGYELDLVGDDQFKQHVDERAEFFRALVPYAAKLVEKEVFTSEDVERFARSRDKLDRIIKEGYSRARI